MGIQEFETGNTNWGEIYTPPEILSNFENKHIISVDQLQRQDINIIFEEARFLKRRSREHDRGLVEIASGKVMANFFFEPSTRTDMSHQAAMRRLGGQVIAASNGVQFSSVYKGENLADTVRAAGCYADIIVLRHPDPGSSYEAAYYLDLLSQKIGRQPALISGGDGIGEHPTQALLDLFTIEEYKGQIGNETLHIAMVGDLENGRTVHSLGKLFSQNGCLDNTTVSLISPSSLKMPAEIVSRMLDKGINVNETDNLLGIVEHADVIYWTRIQEERFANPDEYEAIKDSFIMTPPVLAQAKPDAILMHPLPRKHEMGTESDHDVLDLDPRAIYFQQMENGMFVRMALIKKIIGK